MKDTCHDDSLSQADIRPEDMARRREQDLECLTLLRESMLLQQELAYVDSMLATLKGKNSDDSF